MTPISTELRASLFLLRALLSKISKNKDDCDRIEKEIVQICGQPFTPSRRGRPEGASEEDLALRSALAATEEKETAIKKRLLRQEALYEKQDRPWRPSDLSPYLLFVFLSAAAIFFLARWWIATAFSFPVGLLAIPLTSLLLFLSLVALAECGPAAYERRLSRMKASIKRDYDALARLSEQLPLPETVTALLSADAAEELRREYAAFCDGIREEKQALFGRRDALLKETAALYELTAGITAIDEEEWQTLDVILFELISGRADTLAEARRQADLYRRHNELRRIMPMASTAVSHLIDAEVPTLLPLIRAPLDALQNGEQEHLARVAALIEPSELCHALLEKAGTSSERLCLDLADAKQLYERIFS